MELVYSFTLALFLTIALIPVLIKYSAHLGLVDAPNEARKVHTKVMPRTGGLGIIIGAAVPVFFLLPLDRQLLHLLVGCAIIVVFGLVDDRSQLNYKWKLFGQSCATLVVMAGGFVFSEVPLLGGDQLPQWIGYAITFFFIIGVVNGVNFSDGLDGLAAGASLLVLFLLTFLAYRVGNATYAVLSLTVAGGVLGFLRFNTFPAQLFMGDSGSQFLGFITCCLAVGLTQSDTTAFSAALPLLLLGLPIIDILQVVPVRVVKRLPLPGPDQEHLHHQIAKLGFEHHGVVAIVYLLQFVLLATAYFLRHESDWLIAGAFLVYLIALTGVIFSLQAMNWEWNRVAGRHGVERRNLYLRQFGWFYHRTAEVLQVLIGTFLVMSAFLLVKVPERIGIAALILAACMVLINFARSKLPLALERFVSYPAFIVITYLLASGAASSQATLIMNLFIGALALVLVLSMRMSRRQDFSLNTMDLLIILMVICASLFPLQSMGETNTRQSAMHLMVLLYASEFVINRTKHNARVLMLGAPVAMVLVGIHGLGLFYAG